MSNFSLVSSTITAKTKIFKKDDWNNAINNGYQHVNDFKEDDEVLAKVKGILTIKGWRLNQITKQYQPYSKCNSEKFQKLILHLDGNNNRIVKQTYKCVEFLQGRTPWNTINCDGWDSQTILIGFTKLMVTKLVIKYKGDDIIYVSFVHAFWQTNWIPINNEKDYIYNYNLLQTNSPIYGLRIRFKNALPRIFCSGNVYV